MGILVNGYFRLISKLSEKTSDLGVLRTITGDIPSTSSLVLLSLQQSSLPSTFQPLGTKAKNSSK